MKLFSKKEIEQVQKAISSITIYKAEKISANETRITTITGYSTIEEAMEYAESVEKENDDNETIITNEEKEEGDLDE